ncbi:MAG: fluoride efflux transporter CrcB [Bacteroidales bacterium]|jgi:CrcB protein|nr:fluoride efflux transporter CrcB [Bacteroidales bacterium]
MIKNILLVGFGGFIGSVGRYLISRIHILSSMFSFPLGTLLVNVVGSFILGFLTGIVVRSPILTIEWRVFLMVGFCGGFTTFSTFTNENLSFMRNGEYFHVFLYSGVSIFLGFSAVYLGYIISKLL